MAKTKKDTTIETTETTAAEVDKSAEVVTENTDAVAPAVENSVETVEKTKEAPTESATKKQKTKSAKDSKTKSTAKTPKKTTKKTSKKVKKKVAINGVVPLNGPTTIYRGPGVYPFAKITGVVKPLEDADETGYTKVECVIAGSGACTGFVKL